MTEALTADATTTRLAVSFDQRARDSADLRIEVLAE